MKSIAAATTVYEALTISRHAHCKTFFKPAVLASISVEPHHETFSISQTSVFDLFLYASPEETL